MCFVVLVSTCFNVSFSLAFSVLQSDSGAMLGKQSGNGSRQSVPDWKLDSKCQLITFFLLVLQGGGHLILNRTCDFFKGLWGLILKEMGHMLDVSFFTCLVYYPSRSGIFSRSVSTVEDDHSRAMLGKQSGKGFQEVISRLEG
ncbi:unnamed protein product [Malus baccata var. baccata]